MLRHAIALALFVFGSCIEDGKAFVVGGTSLAGSSKDRANQVQAQRPIVPGDAQYSRYGIGGILEEPDRSRPIISSTLGQTRATSYTRLQDVFSEAEVAQSGFPAATPPRNTAIASSAGVEQLLEESNDNKKCTLCPSKEKDMPASGPMSKPCSAGVKEVEVADSVGTSSTEYDPAYFSASTADIATITRTGAKKDHYRAQMPGKPKDTDYVGYEEIPTSTFASGLSKHPQQYENIGRAALDPDLSYEEKYGVVEENVREILERSKLLKQALSEHASIARRAEHTADVLPPKAINSGFFKRPRPYQSPNVQEQGEREFHAKSAGAEEGEDEPGISTTVGTPVTSVNDGGVAREGDDVGGASLYSSMYTNDEQQGGDRASDKAPLSRKGGGRLKRWWGGLRRKK